MWLCIRVISVINGGAYSWSLHVWRTVVYVIFAVRAYEAVKSRPRRPSSHVFNTINFLLCLLATVHFGIDLAWAIEVRITFGSFWS